MGMSRAERRRMKREQKRSRAENESLRIADGHPAPTESTYPSCEDQGHPEQFAAMLQGVAPTRCPRCGETPQFGQIMQNVDPNLPGYVEDDD